MPETDASITEEFGGALRACVLALFVSLLMFFGSLWKPARVLRLIMAGIDAMEAEEERARSFSARCRAGVAQGTRH